MAQPFHYPQPHKGDTVDDYFGTKIADPYQWLEDTDSPDTRAWIEAQNRLTLAYLAKLPDRADFEQTLTKLLRYERYSPPYWEAGRYVYEKNDGLQNQSVIYTVRSISETSKVLLDPNQLSKEGTVAVSFNAVSPGGELFAYGLETNGSDWNEIHVKEIDSGRELPDVTKWVKFSGVSWSRDNKGYFYSRYPEPSNDTNQKLQGLANQKVYYHRLGEPQEKDRLVYERPDHPDWGFQAFVSKNGRYLVILVWHGADPNNLIFVKDLGNPEEPNFDAPIHPVIDQFTAEYGAIAVLGDQLYVRTDNGAPNYRIVRLDLANPDNGELKEVVPETKDLLQGAAMASGKLVLSYLIDAKSQVFITDLDGNREAEIKLPTLGTVAGLEADQTRSEVFYAFTSFLYPTTIYRYDVDTHRNEVFRKPTVDFSVDDYETRQIFYQSKDGTRIPMFVVCRKDLKLDGSNPVFLTGYGGFNVSLTPSFSTTVITWLQKGGVFAQPNLRGGGEYGREWHLAGTREHKQNVFDDFIAAAEALIDQKYTSKQHLAITGGSNGGLLIGAVLTQRPDLFAACVPSVGVMDMLRFQKFTGGFAWVSDYGSSDNPDDFKFLLKYSPLHNLKPGVCYPATLITTGDHDDRVVPGHSFKFAATLQAYQGCDKPVLIRIDTNAGHGGGKPLSKQIAERADILAFMWDHTKAGPVQ